MDRIRVLVSGAFGRMGRFVVRAVTEARDMELVAAVDPAGVGHSLGEILATDDPTPLSGHLAGSLEEHTPDVMVDFTVPSVVMDNLEAALTRRVPCVVGTTGFSATDLQVVAAMCQRHETPCVIAPNFSIGANLMMLFSAQAAARFDYAEIIERHHENKVDSPSGTALKTAQMMAQAREEAFCSVSTEVDKAPGSRGGVAEGVTVHAVRMPGYVADQEVVLGGLGERLVISHVSISRECFMPGVLLAVRRVRKLSGLTHGLEHLLT
jgi:4-hydroxy-tetrahydrodipicolinate reductase